MTAPTDAELRTAREATSLVGTTDAPGWLIAEVELRVAQALAAQRARLVTAVEKLYREELDRSDDEWFDAGPDYWAGLLKAAQHMRELAES